MPYKSDAQRRFAHTAEGMKKIGKKNVAEMDAASKGKKLPEKAPKKPVSSIDEMRARIKEKLK